MVLKFTLQCFDLLVGLVEIALCLALQTIHARRLLLGLIGRALGGAESGIEFFNLKYKNYYFVATLSKSMEIRV